MKRNYPVKKKNKIKDFNYQVGKRLAGYRVSKGLTQKALGMRVGRTANTISAYESGRSEIPDDMKVKLSKELHFSIDELLMGEDGSLEIIVENGVKQLSSRRIAFYIRLLAAELSIRNLSEAE